MLSLFLETPEVFTNEFIVDELMDFFFAGTLTTQYTTQSIVTHFVHKPESLKKTRDEFRKVVEEEFPDQVYSKDRAYLDEVCMIDVIQELEHLGCVVNEALRFEPPAVIATPLILSQDVKLGDYEFKKGDALAVHIYGLQMNESEWQKPYEFIPERFDSKSEMSLTPDGKKRNATSFAPFGGGMRVCLGKTFADFNIKILTTYLTQSFNFEHVEKKY